MTIDNEFFVKLRDIKVDQNISDRKVKYLIQEFEEDEIRIPDYQRTYVWTSEQACRLIESIFLNVPIPPIFLLEKLDEKTGKTVYEVIDGVQRLTTLVNFKHDKLKLNQLEELVELNCTQFGTLPTSLTSFFLTRQIQTVIIKSSTAPNIQFEIFERLNQGAVSLNHQELRNCMYHGQFNNFLIRLSKNETYRKLLEVFSVFRPVEDGVPDRNRMLDVEFVLRFFCLYELHNRSETKNYVYPTKEVLNRYMRIRTNNEENAPDITFEQLKELFEKVVNMVHKVFGKNSFKKFVLGKTTGKKSTFTVQSTFNKAVFDAEMLGFAEFDLPSIEGKEKIIYEAFLDVSSYDSNFSGAIKFTDQKINSRMNVWHKKLRDVIHNSELYVVKLQAKEKLFANNPRCCSCNQPIFSLEDADFIDDELWHRACYAGVIKQENKTASKQTYMLKIRFADQSREFKDEVEALKEVSQFIVKQVNKKGNIDNEINRLTSLDFIGTTDKFRAVHAQFSATFLSFKNRSDLFINVDGTKKETKEKIEQLISMYDFISVA
jgi:CRISPR/Cas system CSM-associated protein Csm2 small subunit